MTTAEIKFVASLAQKKYRDEYGLFVAEGEKMVSEAGQSGFEIVSIWRKEEIGEKAMGRISSLSTPSPVLAVIRKPAAGELSIPSKGLYLALDTISDPGNLGTILRIADWFGIDGIFASPGTTDLYSPKVVQATMGAVFRVRFATVDIPWLCRSIGGSGGRVYGTFLDGRSIYEHELSNGESAPSVIVIGNESRGISKETAAAVSDRLYIPPFPADTPGSESLNAAVATAVTVAEFRRRLL